MIALVGGRRRIDELVVLDEIGEPLVGLAADEAVIAIEPLLQRPLRARRAGGDVLLRYIMVLAEPEGAPAGALQHLADGRAFIRNASAPARKTLRGFGDAGVAVEMMVAAGEEGGARRRAQRGRVPLR